MDMGKEKFWGNRVVFGCALFIFVVMGGSGIYSSGYSLIPETFHLSITQLGSYGMILTISGIVSSLLLTSLKKLMGLRGLLFYNAAVCYCVAFCAKIFPDSILTLFVFLFSIGTTLYAGAHAVQSEIVSNWFIRERSQKISVVLGSALLGLAFYQFAGGQLFSRMALIDVWFLVYIVNGTVLLLDALFLIVADRPEKIGQKPYGWEDVSDASAVKEKSAGTAKIADTGKRASIYQNPALWLCVLGRLGLCGGVNYITTYATMYFTSGGVSLTAAATILTFCTLSAAAFSFMNGPILERLKSRRYIIFLLSGAILANLGMIVYSTVPNFVLIILVVIFYGIGYGGSHCMNLVANVMFDKEDAANANSKIYGFGAFGGLLMQPLNAYLVQNYGYNTMYFVIIIMTVIALLAFMIALSVAQKQGKNIG